MPKSAADATRFTSTTPHASAKPPPTSSKAPLPNRTPGPPGETPQQKVRRLREAAARARNAQVSTFDKFLVRGRVWADKAHRFTALSLIGLTGIAGVVTVYALGDMMIHNRRKRREYFAEQQAVHAAQVYEAQQAIRRGTASEEQQSLVQREEQIRQAEAAKNAPKGPGVFARSKEWLFSGLKKEEEGGAFSTSEERVGYDGTVAEDEIVRSGESKIMKAVEERKTEVAEAAERATKNEVEIQRRGGPLDQYATGVATTGASAVDTPKQGGGWTSFMSRR